MKRQECSRCPTVFNKMRRIYVSGVRKTSNGKDMTVHLGIGWICLNCKQVILD